MSEQDDLARLIKNKEAEDFDSADMLAANLEAALGGVSSEKVAEGVLAYTVRLIGVNR